MKSFLITLSVTIAAGVFLPGDTAAADPKDAALSILTDSKGSVRLRNELIERLPRHKDFPQFRDDYMTHLLSIVTNPVDNIELQMKAVQKLDDLLDDTANGKAVTAPATYEQYFRMVRETAVSKTSDLRLRMDAIRSYSTFRSKVLSNAFWTGPPSFAVDPKDVDATDAAFASMMGDAQLDIRLRYNIVTVLFP